MRVQSPSLRPSRTPWRPQLQLRAEPWQRRDPAEGHRQHHDECDLVEQAEKFSLPKEFDRWQQCEAKARLVRLCAWLDRNLDKPLQVAVDCRDGERRVEALGCVCFTANPVLCSLDVYHMAFDGRWHRDWSDVDIGHAMHPRDWLRFVIEFLRLSPYGQGNLLFDERISSRINQWIIERVSKLLLGSRRFAALRTKVLAALAIPPEILGIARACRILPENRVLQHRLLDRVWMYEDAFRRLARETPQLLPIMHAYWWDALVEGESPSRQHWWDNNPVADFKRALLQRGLQPATWRYLVRHGSRLFRPVWEVTPIDCRFESAVSFLEMLEWAGLPPPPPPSVTRALMHAYNAHDGDQICLKPGFFHFINREVMRAAFLEADHRRGCGDLADFLAEMLGVFEWSRLILDFSDSRQIKAGWPWMVRQARTARDEFETIRRIGSRRWTARLGCFSMGEVDIVPLTSTADMVRESSVLHNCVQDYVDECAGGEMEIYSIRSASSEKRIGCVGFQFDDDGFPRFFDAKRLANEPPNTELRRLASEINRRLFEHAIRLYCVK